MANSTTEDGFTRTQQRLLAVLGDGMPHKRKELHACLNDETQPLSGTQMHLSRIRKILRPKGQDIICEYYQGTLYYRWVRLLKSE